MSDKEVLQLTKKCWKGEMGSFDYANTLVGAGVKPDGLRRILRYDLYWFIGKCCAVVCL